MVKNVKLYKCERGGGEGGLLRISSDGDDRMGAKIKTKKTLGLPTKSKALPQIFFNNQKIPTLIKPPEKYLPYSFIPKKILE